MACCRDAPLGMGRLKIEIHFQEFPFDLENNWRKNGLLIYIYCIYTVYIYKYISKKETYIHEVQGALTGVGLGPGLGFNRGTAFITHNNPFHKGLPFRIQTAGPQSIS